VSCHEGLSFDLTDSQVQTNKWGGAMPPKQCAREGCSKAAASGGTPHCTAHGGGKRCQEEDCTKSAQGDTGYCVGQLPDLGLGNNTSAEVRELLKSTPRRLSVVGIKEEAWLRHGVASLRDLKTHGFTLMLRQLSFDPGCATWPRFKIVNTAGLHVHVGPRLIIIREDSSSSTRADRTRSLTSTTCSRRHMLRR
jgi:hypothetical protein